MAKTVFISRAQTKSSVFAAALQAGGWQVYGRSLLTLTPLPLAGVPVADWIFFASRHAVQFFLEQAGAGRLAALGPGTAAEIRRLGRAADFTGTGDPHATAQAFLPLAAGQRVLFPAARHSQQSILKLLGRAIEAIQLPVYDNAPLPDPPRLNQDILVFTSPMNAEAYFARRRLQPHQRVIAIGRTTAGALTAMGAPVAAIAAEPTEIALAKTVLSLGQ